METGAGAEEGRGYETIFLLLSFPKQGATATGRPGLCWAYAGKRSVASRDRLECSRTAFSVLFSWPASFRGEVPGRAQSLCPGAPSVGGCCGGDSAAPAGWLPRGRERRRVRAEEESDGDLPPQGLPASLPRAHGPLRDSHQEADTRSGLREPR